ncbi:DUF1648 domain-containing protein [Marisediminicola sp. LYQ134]|uniref:DUF1648 domain-containing protein n=1 Tax=Marisediminicola sp. LYQ134 TaxID=3391061 RepID=UPI00398362C7
MSAPAARPRRSFTSSPAIRGLRWAGCLAVLVVAVAVAAVYPSLPAELPVHFGGSGPDTIGPDTSGVDTNSGPRSMIWVLLGVWLALQLLVAVLSTHPHRLNYPAPVTESNAQTLYRRGEEMAVWLGIAVACAFLGLVLLVLGAAAAVPLLVVGIASLFAVTIVGTVRLLNIS